jgi:hypothetical protein
MNIGTALVAGLLLTPLAAAGNHAPASSVIAFTAWQALAVDKLATMPDADAQVTAAALARLSPDGSKSIQLIDRALAIAPHAADIGLLDVAVCGMQSGCDVLNRETSQRRIDPGNGAAWMATLHDASARGDKTRVNAILANMAQAKRFDTYFTPLGRRFISALKRVSIPQDSQGDTPEARRQAQAMAMVAALAIPALQDVLHACKPDAPISADRRNACRGIAASMQRGDTMIANLVGLRLQEWTARDAADRAQALAQRRLLQWRMAQLNAISGTPALSPTSQMASTLKYDREIDGVDAMLANADKPLDPPADWQPPQPKGSHPPSSP